MKYVKNDFSLVERIISDQKSIANDFFKFAEHLISKYHYVETDCADLLADWYFSKGDHINCLTACSYYCAVINESESLFAIVEEYYRGYIDMHRETYKHNRELLKEYEWYKGSYLPDFDELENVLLFQDDTSLIYIERKNGNMKLVKKDPKFYVDGRLITFVGNLSDIKAIDQIKKQVELIVIEWNKRPLYVYYENNFDFHNVLQAGGIDCLLENNHVVFLVGWESARLFLCDDQCQFANQIIFGESLSIEKRAEIRDRLERIRLDYETEAKIKYDQNIKYYKKNGQKVKRNIQSGSPKILFVTCRFTTAIQYHTRDCLEMCKRLGMEAQILIEKSDIHGLNNISYIKVIHEFQPDIIFVIDHFRNKILMPPEIIYICWVQDPLNQIMDRKSPRMMKENDYILSHYPTIPMLKEIGYDTQKILYAPVPANHLIYKPYSINKEEFQRYQSDICLVANGCDYSGFVKKAHELLLPIYAALGLPNKDVIEEFYDNYYQKVYFEKIQLYFESDADLFLRSLFRDKNIEIKNEEVFSKLVNYFFLFVRAVVFRSVLVEWLIDGGYTNLKLYGRDWGDNPKFKPYAMGMAENGEPLAKIYQSAKITLGTNPVTTGAARFYECYLSGGFYISNFIVPEADLVNLRDYFKEGEEVPFYYGRQDLYEKLDYYLTNEEIRRKKSRDIREKMLKVMTYEILMKKMVKWLGKREDIVREYMDQFQEVLVNTICTRLDKSLIPFDSGIENALDVLMENKRKHKQLFFVGNGGSAGICSHMTADFLKTGGMRSISLQDASTLTCMGNDLGYELIYSEQLNALAQTGDILIAISSSGNSPNILKAVQAAREKGCHIITLSGFHEDNLLRLVGDFNFYVPISKYGIVESIHNFILQMMVDLIAEKGEINI